MTRSQVATSALTAVLIALSVAAAPGVASAGIRQAIASPIPGKIHKPGGTGLMCPTVCETINGQTVCYTDCRPN